MTKKDLSSLGDHELIERSRSGDTAATDFLMEKYKGLVIQKARPLYLIGADREDILQEGMLGLFKAVRDYNPKKDASFFTFASLCVTRQIYSAVQASGRKKHLPLNSAISLYTKGENGSDEEGLPSPSIEDTLAGEEATPEEQIVGRENTRILEEKIAKRLSPLEKQVLELQLKGLSYTEIAINLDRSPKSIDNAIQRVKKKLEDAGFKFHIKGRTKSIHSIYQKMKKQKCGFEGIYDLFAIRIILDAPPEKEKMQCWQVYSIITDMYQPNPKRLRDWLSVPKSNGYESLHITVLGPENKWVEVQIRTERMDEIAEHGLAAHWRYKGIKSEGGIDEWLANIRAALENNDNLQLMDQFKLDLYEDEVYVFTPKGDLFKLAKGATVLDFAYLIHTDVGNHCVGARINGRTVQMREELHSGDTVEIMTSKQQEPKHEWLNLVKTAKAKAKIRLALKETQVKAGLYAKELLERRFKNKKIEVDEKVMAKLVKKLGFKETSDFYSQIADGKLDANDVIEKYIELRDHENQQANNQPVRSAEEFEYENPDDGVGRMNDDVLVIDQSLKGIDYTLARCCHPIYGDPVFGFVTVNGGIKIHRMDCPNAPELRKRFGYRIVRAQWSGKGSSQYTITLRIIGNDNIGIVSNITNIISKDEKIDMRSINIDSEDGLFRGNLVVQLNDTSKLQSLIKKLRTVKGVIDVTRI